MKREDLIKSVTRRLSYSKNCLEDINSFVENNKLCITNECKNFIAEQQSKYSKNFTFYTEILRVLGSEFNGN